MELLLAGDAAKRLGLSSDMVRVLERRGKLRAFRTPAGVRLFRARDIEALAERRRQERETRGALESAGGIGR